MRKPIVVVTYDSEGWAFHRIALQIEKRLSDEFDFRLQLCRDPVSIQDADVVLDLFYGRGDPEALPPGARSITCIYDGWYWINRPVLRANVERAAVAGSHVLFSNMKFAADFVPVLRVLHPVTWGLCQDGVDTNLFHAAPLDRSRRTEFTVGWAGNMQHAMKGVELIHRACKALDGVRLDCVGAGGQSWPLPGGGTISKYPPSRGFIAYEDMPAWYQGLDVYVCASDVEGTPNPILEASASGIPWISTDVGIVPELIADAGDGLKPGIVIDRSTEAIAKAIRTLRDDPGLGEQMGAAGRRIIERNWDWSKRIEAFREAIRFVLGRA